MCSAFSGARRSTPTASKPGSTDNRAISDLFNLLPRPTYAQKLAGTRAFFRALNARAPNGRFLDSFFGDPRNPNAAFANYPMGFLSFPLNQTGQQPLSARSVFNFFSPTYSPPGPVAAAGLVAATIFYFPEGLQAKPMAWLGMVMLIVPAVLLNRQI